MLNPNLPINGQLKLQAELFNINKLKIYNLYSLINIDEKEFYLKSFDGDLFDGKISVEGKRSNKNEYEYKGSIKVSNINGNALINNYFTYNKIEGDINSKVKVYGKARNLRQFFKTLNAKGEIFIKNPTIKGLDINKLIETKNIKELISIDEFIIEAFNTNKQAEINNFSIKYNINDNEIIFEEENLKIAELNSWFKGKFNFYNLDANASLKINIDDSDNKSIFLNFIHNKDVKNIVIDNNYILNNNTSENVINNDEVNQIKPPSENIATDDFEDLIDNLSKNSLVSDFDNDSLLEHENNIDNDKIVESTAELFKLPEYLKDLENPIYKAYSKPKIIKNIIIKPKLPTQEDLLDNLLENILNP